MTDRTVKPTWEQFLTAHSEKWFARFHAPIQGRVHSYTVPTVPGAHAVADVEPLVLMSVAGLDLERSPILRGVPIIFPGGSVAGYTYPLTPGSDTVALLPQDADLDAYVASGTVGQRPGSRRRFDLSDAIAIPNNLRGGNDPLPPSAFAADSGVLWGLHRVGSGSASLFAALDTDQIPKNSLMGTWMSQVEAAVNASVPPPLVPVFPLSTTFTSIGNVQATATKLKVE